MSSCFISINRFLSFAFLTTILFAAPVHASSDSMEGVDPKIAKICASVADLEAPVKDMPSSEDKAKLDCNKDAYYGVGTAVDYVLARKCAFIEAQRGSRDAFSGNSVLMMIYANGRGVPKNVDLALHFACDDQDGTAPAEFDGRIAHLAEIKKLKIGQKMTDCIKSPGYTQAYCNGVFDYCDDVTSGMMEGVCASRESDIAEAKKAAEFSNITAAWTEADRKAFASLEKAADAYISAHSENEIDLSGTARGMFVVEEQDASKEQFRKAIRTFDGGALPVFAAADLDKADKELNRTYVHVMRAVETPSNLTTVHKDDVRATQKLWLSYRDAWVKFAAQHYPKVTPIAINAWATQARVDELKGVLELTK
jgi:uncharacterized protein YecT (DUF1311 family)